MKQSSVGRKKRQKLHSAILSFMFRTNCSPPAKLRPCRPMHLSWCIQCTIVKVESYATFCILLLYCYKRTNIDSQAYILSKLSSKKCRTLILSCRHFKALDVGSATHPQRTKPTSLWLRFFPDKLHRLTPGLRRWDDFGKEAETS